MTDSGAERAARKVIGRTNEGEITVSDNMSRSEASPAPQPEPTPRQDTAFNRIMGLGSMPPDESAEYDLWLFEKSYEAGAASERARADAAERQLRDMREALALAVDQASPCECDNNGHCGYCVGAAALLSRKEDKAQ